MCGFHIFLKVMLMSSTFICTDRCIKNSFKTPVFYNACKVGIMNVFFFTCWLWISYWKLNILAIIYRLLTHFQFCKIYNFEFSRACKIMKQFILALQNRAFCRLDQLKSFCEFVSVRENSVEMFVFNPEESKHGQD